MIFGKKRSEDTSQEVEARDRVITYKQTFGSPEGKKVLFDLMNRYHILNSHKGDTFSEGQRSVVLQILTQCNIDLAEFDRLLKGE